MIMLGVRVLVLASPTPMLARLYSNVSRVENVQIQSSGLKRMILRIVQLVLEVRVGGSSLVVESPRDGEHAAR
jgi:hypothetical protein